MWAIGRLPTTVVLYVYYFQVLDKKFSVKATGLLFPSFISLEPAFHGYKNRQIVYYNEQAEERSNKIKSATFE
jgi:hypothetical protein